MRIICNASPLIFLSKIDRLDLLNSLFDEVLVPVEAWNEATKKSDNTTKALEELKSSGKISMFTVKNGQAVSAMIGRLHRGEVEVIVGAGEVEISHVILDDGYARNKAKQMGLFVTGTLGVLLAGHQKGLIADLNIEINKLRNVGFRISDSIVDRMMNT